MALKPSTLAASPSSTSSIFSISPKLNPIASSNSIAFRLQSRIPFLKSFKCFQSHTPHSISIKSNTRDSGSSFRCSATTFSPSQTAETVSSKLRRLVDEFQALSEPVDRVKRLLHYASLLPPMAESARVDSNRVMGCTAQVWLEVRIDEDGKMRFAADSDSEISRGFCSCLVSMLDGCQPDEVLKVKTEDLISLNVGLPGNGRSRVNTWHNVLISMQKRTMQLIAKREGKAPFEPFPSLIIAADGVHPKGSYAEAQVRNISLPCSTSNFPVTFRTDGLFWCLYTEHIFFFHF